MGRYIKQYSQDYDTRNFRLPQLLGEDRQKTLFLRKFTLTKLIFLPS